MKVYNTLTGKKEELRPLNKGKIGMYVCGPTVYDFGHVGHGRSAVSFDVIRKYFIYKGFQVNFVSNYTDIDDKMIHRAELMKISVPQLAERIIPEYQKDYAALRIMPADVSPKATDHVAEMIQIIEGLEQKGYTYVLDDGVYFDVTQFPEYGKLSKQKMDELRSGIRVAVKEGKRNPQDFVLWKFSKPGEPTWPSKWGEGRPGWHIECSAMSSKYLGETFDVHCGGADLIFPHHECEIAQSEAFNGKPFAKYWFHNGFINVNNEKMSKSLGNFFTLKDIFKEFDPQVVRFFFLQTHYRSPIEFSFDLLLQAKNGLMRLHDFMHRLENYIPSANDTLPSMHKLLENIGKNFQQGMDDDFETAEALAACFDLVKEVNRRIDTRTLSKENKREVLDLVDQFDAVLGIFFSGKVKEVDEKVEALIKQREEARKNKDWATSDRIRDELLAQGIQLEDTAQGTTWKMS